MELALIRAIVELAIKYGIPGAIAIIRAWETEGDPTAEDIADLREMTLPEDFFE